MNKKELENIYNHLENTIIRLGRQNGKNQFVKDLNYLLEQAKRVQELEDFIYQDTRQAVLEGLYEENERYRKVMKVIEKYANDCIDVEVEMNPYLVLDDIKTLEEMK